MSLSPQTRARLRQSAITPLLVCVLALAALVAATTAVASVLSSGATAPKPITLQGLAEQLVRAQAPQVLSGRFDLVNHLLPSGQHDAGGDQPSSPLQSGGSGRFWYQAPDRLRVELQGSGGDIQIVRDGRLLWFYDPATRTANRIALPAAQTKTKTTSEPPHQPPTSQQIADSIARLQQHWNVSGPTPTVQGNRRAYALALAPHDAGSLLASVVGAVDSATGIPLRFELHAVGVKDPVISLAITDLNTTSADPSVFAFAPPSGTKVDSTTLQNLLPGVNGATAKTARATSRHGSRHAQPAATLASARRVAKFALVAPQAAGTRSLSGIQAGAHTALLRYGDGPGTIVVLERAAAQPKPVGTASVPGHKASSKDSGRAALPTVTLPGGVAAQELSTPLGTVLSWRHGGVSFLVAGSRPAAEVLGVAQALAAS
ncbi:MAG: LolA family protein [Solirubrobacteraceae bacterium]|nr:MAG: hypothetical protein DLM63_08855 [Solirubrobacterales bacterium]